MKTRFLSLIDEVPRRFTKVNIDTFKKSDILNGFLVLLLNEETLFKERFDSFYPRIYGLIIERKTGPFKLERITRTLFRLQIPLEIPLDGNIDFIFTISELLSWNMIDIEKHAKMEEREKILLQDLNKVRSDYNETVKYLRSKVDRISLLLQERDEFNRELENTVQKRTIEIKELQKELLASARMTGRAEIASSIMHNMGNILNSLKVSSELVRQKVRNSHVVKLQMVSDLIREHKADLGTFITSDEQGKYLPEYLMALALELKSKRESLQLETDDIGKHIEHISNVIQIQQSLGKIAGVIENVRIDEIINNALKISEITIGKRDIVVAKEFSDIGPSKLDRLKVLDILVNLIKNAIEAFDGMQTAKKIIIATKLMPNQMLQIIVRDNGGGILDENVSKIFSFGFTTKINGHGFGLHHCFNTIGELGGRIVLNRYIAEKETEFMIELPYLT